MPRRTPEIPISPAVLEWARETAGFTHDEVSHHLGVAREQVEGWEKEAGQVYLRVRQLEDLAHYYKRPLAALLLTERPDEPKPPQDFRRPLQRDKPFSHSLRLAIRRAKRLQRVAREMMEAMELSPVSDIPQVNLQQQPEIVAKAQRKAFGITTKEQLGWRNSGHAFRCWREVLEARSVLVFQSDFPREEAQGFSLSDDHPYAIMVSSADFLTARCFTLFHELAHLLLRQGGVCITEVPYSQISNNLAKTENWCHRFAEAFLIDEEVLRDRDETQAVIRSEPGYEEALKRLAFSFKVSQAVVLFRFWHSELISEGRFSTEYAKLQRVAQIEAEQIKKKRHGKGWPSPAQQVVQERGRLLPRLVLEALDRQMLGYTEAVDYLGVRLKHLDKIRQEAYG